MEQLTAAQQAAELNKKNLFATYNHIEAEFVEPDHAIFKLEIRPESKNPYGIVHGGAIYTMAGQRHGLRRPHGWSILRDAGQLDAFSPQPVGGRRARGRQSPPPRQNDLPCQCGHFRRGRQAPRHGRVHLFLHRSRYHGTEGRAAPLRRV